MEHRARKRRQRRRSDDSRDFLRHPGQGKEYAPFRAARPLREKRFRRERKGVAGGCVRAACLAGECHRAVMVCAPC